MQRAHVPRQFYLCNSCRSAVRCRLGVVHDLFAAIAAFGLERCYEWKAQLNGREVRPSDARCTMCVFLTAFMAAVAVRKVAACIYVNSTCMHERNEQKKNRSRRFSRNYNCQSTGYSSLGAVAALLGTYVLFHSPESVIFEQVCRPRACHLAAGFFCDHPDSATITGC